MEFRVGDYVIVKGFIHNAIYKITGVHTNGTKIIAVNILIITCDPGIFSEVEYREVGRLESILPDLRHIHLTDFEKELFNTAV